jgi:CheY-like chemotaxis protein
MRMFVELLGGEAKTFSDPEVALDEVSRTTFDVAILDVHMPKLDGIGLAQRLRNGPWTSHNYDQHRRWARGSASRLDRQQFAARLFRILAETGRNSRSANDRAARTG